MATCTDTRKGFAFDNPDITSSYHAPKFGFLVHPDELRYDEMFGNALIAEADSQSITDTQLANYARVAIGYLERELNIDILPRLIRYNDQINDDGNKITRTDIDDTGYLSTLKGKQKKSLYIREPGYTYRVIASRRESRVKLRRRPVRDILTANFVDPYFSTTIIDLMPYRILKQGYTGAVFFRPRHLTARTNYYLYVWEKYLLRPWNNDMQNIFLIDYETGYENCEDVPEDLYNIVKKLSAVTLMNIYGDGKLAAIASRSVNLNSVSESINTTLSATSATFGARIIQYQKEIKQWFIQNRSKYSRTMIGNLGGS